MARRGPVLILGAAGLVGSHLRRALRGRDTAATFHRASVEGAEQVDVTDASAVNAIAARVRPSVIILAAAEPYVERCEREPTATALVNVGGTANARAAADDHGALLVVFSSEYVFDGRASPYGEDDEPHPLNEYGRQKVEVERIARTGAHLICRTSGVFGHEPSRKNFVLQLVDALRHGQTFTVPSDQAITPSYAPSLARAVVELIDHGAEGTFHVCGPRVLRRTEFAEMVEKAFALPPGRTVARPTAELGLPARRPLAAGLADAKLRGAIGHGLTDPVEALREMAEEAR